MQLKNSKLFREACLLNGKWIEAGADGIEVYNPATGEVIGKVPRLGSAETEQVIADAVKAWEGWRNTPAKERGALIRRWKDLILANVDDLATILTLEQGKPLAEARGEVMGGASFLDWSAEECRRTYGETVPSPFGPKALPMTVKESAGVAMAITPWNFPFSLVCRKAGPSLGAGCPMIVKPATATPYVAIAIAVLAEEAGIPAGVFNVITGNSAQIGDAVMKSSDVRVFSFTGSTAVGKKLMAQCAGTVKKIAMELGGNAPFVVFDDANLELAIAQAHAGKLRNAGQICVAPNRFLVQESVHDAFVKGVVELGKTVKLGNGMDEGVTMGPLVDRPSVENMVELVKDAVSKGAKVLVGGAEQPAGSHFFQYTILDGVTPDMRVYREEIFGPIMSITTFKTEEEAIAMANDTEYGLAAYLYSQDIGRCWRVASGIESGIVGVNEVGAGIGEAPFGGMKESGSGREGGTEGFAEYQETKYVLLGNLQ